MSGIDRTELLEARAERGTQRGADAVWQQASAAAERGANRRNEQPMGWFRLAMGVCAIAMVASIGFAIDRGRSDTAAPLETGLGVETADPSDSDTSDSDTADSDTVAGSGENPKRILIDGMSMNGVQIPADPDFAGDDDFLDRLSGRITESESSFVMPPEDQPVERVIFANPTDPFANPILGIDLLDGGGFRPWAMNLGELPLETLTESVNRSDGEWTVDEESGLIEVARFSDEPYNLLRYGWQFDFRSGSDAGTWQAEPHNGAGMWTWMARIAGTSSERLTSTVTEIRVLDRQGIVVEQTFGAEAAAVPDRHSGVFWVDEDFVYRLTAAQIDGNNHNSGDPTPLVPRLRIVDDASWDDQVANATSGGFLRYPFGISELVTVLITIGCFLAIVLWLRRRPASQHPPAKPG